VTDEPPLQILLLEDDPGDAQLIRDLLEEGHFACDVTRVQTRVEFAAALKNKAFDLILADHNLPSFDGLSALKLVGEAGLDPPFIFISGSAGEEVAIEALKIGAADYVLKSGLSRLVPAVQRALRETQEKTERNKAEQGRRRAERAARRMDRELRDLIENIPAMAFIALPGPHSAFASRNWRQYTGMSEDDSAGSGWQKVVHPDDLERHLAKWKASDASGKPFEDEVRLRRAADGEYRWFLVRAVPALDDAGNLKWYGVATDFEDRLRAEDASREAQAELAHLNRIATMGQLTASIAHEVSQPMAAALTYAQTAMRLLRAEPLDLEEVRGALSRIVESMRRGGDVIGRIRAIVKKTPLQKDSLSLNEAIQEVVALTRGEAVKNGVAVQTSFASGLPSVAGDRVQLQQVMMNLILNAIEAMSATEEEGRQLRISTEGTDAGEVLVTVRDSGPGLNPAHIERVFEAFYTTKNEGMGMGLAICRSIIEAHNGHLWAGANETGGAAFRFTLPPAPKEPHAEP
jgi:PAS domain S-box-containing protein